MLIQRTQPLALRRYNTKPKATLEHYTDEYLICAPDGYRFEGLECHEIVIAYGAAGLTRSQGRKDAVFEINNNPLEKCPQDCPCLEE